MEFKYLLISMHSVHWQIQTIFTNSADFFIVFLTSFCGYFHFISSTDHNQVRHGGRQLIIQILEVLGIQLGEDTIVEWRRNMRRKRREW